MGAGIGAPGEGGRVFVQNRLPRKGLQTGDVVALALANTGELLAAAKVRNTTVDEEDGNSAQRQYTLIPMGKATLDDEVVLLEVVRNGQWIGFKSWVADNALLQAKKKGTYRLAFFSTRFGVYEQWECGEKGEEGDRLPMDGIHWASTVVTLRNRKVPSVVLKVELHRAGLCQYTSVRGTKESGDAVTAPVLMPSIPIMPAPVPPPSEQLPPVTATIAGASTTTQTIHTMSNMMVHEWIKFVEKEKSRRARLQAKVDQATEDVEGLRRWAAMQIQCARQDVQEEIELLLDTLNDRNAALADVQARLDTRIQWGAALLEAKKATVLGRRVLLAWKAKTARARYCEAVVNKLRKRSQVRVALRALDTWRDEVEERKDLQKRLRAGVRRMSYLKMQSAFSAWRRNSHEAFELARLEAAKNQDAKMIADSQRAKGAFAAWRKRAARTKEARRLLGFAANRAREQMLASAFSTWKVRVQRVRVQSVELERRVRMREKMRLSGAVFYAWRLAVDDGYGEKIEHGRSVAYDVKKTFKKVFAAWRSRVEEVKEIEVAAEVTRLQRARAVGAGMLVLWQQHASVEAATRTKLVQFVHSRALRCMKKALWFWTEHAAFSRGVAAYVARADGQRAVEALHGCLAAWRTHAFEKKIQRRYVKICTERRQLKQAKTVFGAWRAANRRSNKTFEGLLDYTDSWAQRRMRKALGVMREYAAEKARERALEAKAAKWREGRLAARMLGALQAETDRHSRFEGRLLAIGEERNQALKRVVWNAWLFEVEETTGREANLQNFQLRKSWHVLNQAFLAWRNITAEEKFLSQTAISRQLHVDAMRVRWALRVWRGEAQARVADRLQDCKADNWHRFKTVLAVFRAWRARKDVVQEAKMLCDGQYAQRQLQTKHGLLVVWRETADYHRHLRSVLHTITNTRALEMQQAVFNAWREKVAASNAEAALILRAVNKLSSLRTHQAFEHWRQMADDAQGKTMYLARMQALVDRKHVRSTLKAAFAAWRTRCLDIQAGLQQFEERDLARLAVVKSTVFSSWKNHSDRAMLLREKALATVVQRRSSRLMIQAFVSWRHETTTQARNDIVMMHAVDRLSFRMMKEAMFAWRIATVERKRRRDVMVSLMERSLLRSLGDAFSAWRQQVAEDIRIRQNLERCIMQKRVAYELYRESYWETVDEELQETLRAMFREAETDEEDLDIDSGLDADDVMASSEIFCRSVELEIGIDLDDSEVVDLKDIAEAFEAKRRELSAKVRAAVGQGGASPGHAMTPPKRELNVLEPLNRFFSSRLGGGCELASGADSLSLSVSSLGSSLCCTEDLEGLGDLEDWSSCDEDEGDEGDEEDLAVAFTMKSAANGGGRKALFDMGVLEEPTSPRILARI